MAKPLCFKERPPLVYDAAAGYLILCRNLNMLAKTLSLVVFILTYLQPSTALEELTARSCEFPAIFNFGDSTSDTGGIHVSFPFMTLAEEFPYGETFFHRPVNRYSDGRLLIDFIAQGLGKPFLSPYLQSVDSNFTHGANFASSGATARNIRSVISPFNLHVQINQYKVFKDQVALALEQKGPQDYLPEMVAFVKGLHIIQIGGSDFSHAYMNLKMNTKQIHNFLPGIVNSIGTAVKDLYETGARTFWVMDVGPQGCLPFVLSKYPHTMADLDDTGCALPYNEVVVNYNQLLRSQLSILQDQFSDAAIVYVDTYSIIYTMIQNAPRFGFEYTTRACCGVGGNHNYDYGVQCGSSNHVHGQYLTALPCVDPTTYLNWDGVHLTDRANRLLARHILSGSFFHPFFPISELCPSHIHTI
ncbi:hypothetical protein GOP47_0011461 [Adiantum capillus-veneris]|uniref:GDSL esterase/lipase n=1 Tax=Adiantum capillus-veneris TaxID=13818 RepID=A0A9D4ZFF2_ADICA|nr:hypothetical protein GOP47_0011461 [Adiantum capillus-veneris]